MKSIILTFALILAATAGTFAQKFAYVDTDYILDNIPEYKAAQEKVDALSVEWQKDIEEKFAEIDKLYKQFQAEAVLLPEDIKKKREDEIVLKEKTVKDLQKAKFGKDGELFKKKQELVKPIQDKVYNAIEEIAVAGNYSIIFDSASNLTMLYVSSKLDKSNEVLEKLGYTPGKTTTPDKTTTTPTTTEPK